MTLLWPVAGSQTRLSDSQHEETQSAQFPCAVSVGGFSVSSEVSMVTLARKTTQKSMAASVNATSEIRGEGGWIGRGGLYIPGSCRIGDCVISTCITDEDMMISSYYSVYIIQPKTPSRKLAQHGLSTP